jgi:hypothetical protein
MPPFRDKIFAKTGPKACGPTYRFETD